MNILVINGPNLNNLGLRNVSIYGNTTLKDIESTLAQKAEVSGVTLSFYQSNSEGAIIDKIQELSEKADGIIINPGALTHYGYSLRDALEDTRLPIIEVHLSNIYAREEWRSKSVISGIAIGQISGLGYKGYEMALESMTRKISEQKNER